MKISTDTEFSPHCGAVVAVCICLSAVQLHAATGVRKLSALPPPGVHPRVLFTGDDWPDIKRRLSDPGPYGKVVVARLRHEIATCRCRCCSSWALC